MKKVENVGGGGVLGRFVHAFTLAEVLITLGIIGLIAILICPFIVQNYQNKVVSTRLKNFYTNFSQAITMAESDYGNKAYWLLNVGANRDLEWCKKYIYPYMNIVKAEVSDSDFINGKYIYHLADGTSFAFVSGHGFYDILFWPSSVEKCDINNLDNFGKCAFWFTTNQSKAIVPSRSDYGIGSNALLGRCKSVSSYFASCDCTFLIAVNGWSIPKNYPKKVRY